MGRSAKTDRSSSASKQTRDPEATKAQILDAAEEEFARYGLNGARTEAIAAKTGVTKAMIYYYFSSKEGLYQAVLKRYPTNFLAIVKRLNPTDISPEDALKAMVRAGIAHEATHPHQGKILLHEAMQNGGQYFKLTGGWEEAISLGMEVLKRGIAEGCFRPVDPFLTMIHIMGTITFYFNAENNLKNIASDLEWMSPKAIEQFTESAIAFILAGVRAEPNSNLEESERCHD
ncbi:MAG: hypothetical protein Kow00121_31090 [Elainellaceae cyanobacterium]